MDEEKSVYWLKKAAVQGNKNAKDRLKELGNVFILNALFKQCLIRLPSSIFTTYWRDFKVLITCIHYLFHEKVLFV